MIRVFMAMFLVLAAGVDSGAEIKERKGEVTFTIKLDAPADAKNVRLWVPHPVSDGDQSVEDLKISGNFTKSDILREGEYGSAMVFAEWDSPVAERTLTYSFKVKRKESVNRELPKTEEKLAGGDFKKFMKATSLGPVTGLVRERALKITEGKNGTVEKSRAIYDWIVNNMYRDPDVKGCGLGDVEQLLIKLGGKCGDIHSVYVALARSVGIPAREAFGLRMAKGKEGDITKSQHCWAEFYLAGYGWVPVDPSDVRKYMLENKIANPSDIPEITEYYFGSVDANRMVLGHGGRDLVLNPPQKGEKLNYFMYPYAEADGKTLNEDLFGFNLGYKITFKEIQ